MHNNILLLIAALVLGFILGAYAESVALSQGYPLLSPTETSASGIGSVVCGLVAAVVYVGALLFIERPK